MIKRPKLSLMIHTASFDTFLESQEIKSYFESLCKNLCEQSLKEIELIYTDTFYEFNKNNFHEITKQLPFVVKHVPIHKNHRYYFDKGYTYISAAKNTGILYADGELLVTCDDAEFFPNHLLALYYDYFTKGNYMVAMHNRMKSIVTNNGIPVFPIKGDIYINDHRFKAFSGQSLVHRNGTWTYAGTSFSLEDALIMNGFNEKMDSCKSLEDCEFGSRLQMLGRSFVSDKNGILYILDHQSYSTMVRTAGFHEDGQVSELDCHLPTKKNIDNLIAIENYGICQCTTTFKEITANKITVTDKHLEIIQRETIKYRGFDPLADDNKEKMNIWMNVPNFDLASERQELRNSPEWRW